MFRSSRWVLHIRHFTAASTGLNFDLGGVAMVVRERQLPIHVHYPYTSKAKRISPMLKGRRPLEMLLLEPKPEQHLGMFPNGVMVGFGMSKKDLVEFQESLSKFQMPKEEAEHPKNWIVREGQFTLLSELATLGYEAPDEVGHSSYIDEGPLDAIVLSSADPVAKLPFIHCLAELIQLEALNDALVPIANTVKGWTEEVKKSGSLICSLKDARQAKARLHRLQALQGKLDNRVQIFWDGEFNHLRNVFNDAYDHYEVQARNTALKQRLDSLGESVAYLSEETHAQTNHHLEWVIIILIFMSLVNALLTH